MKRILICLSALLIIAATVSAEAEENGPIIVPERIQKLAFDHPLADRLGIKWDSANAQDIGRYLGFLAATNEVAKSIARRNSRSEPSDFDYQASFAALCLWPPNKPPIVEQYWDKIIPAFYSQKVRSELDKAVGKVAADLPSFLENGESMDAIMAMFPAGEKEYFDTVLNLENLKDDQ